MSEYEVKRLQAALAAYNNGNPVGDHVGAIRKALAAADAVARTDGGCLKCNLEFQRLKPRAFIRPEVKDFAALMEQKLKANDHKPGWKNDSFRALFRRLEQEMRELRECPDEFVIDEAIDVANFAMMIADNAENVWGYPLPKETP